MYPKEAPVTLIDQSVRVLSELMSVSTRLRSTLASTSCASLLNSCPSRPLWLSWIFQLLWCEWRPSRSISVYSLPQPHWDVIPGFLTALGQFNYLFPTVSADSVTIHFQTRLSSGQRVVGNL